MYQTYRRIDIPSPFFASVYTGGVVAVLVVVLPLLVVRPNVGHMHILSAGVATSRFVSTVPDYGDADCSAGGSTASAYNDCSRDRDPRECSGAEASPWMADRHASCETFLQRRHETRSASTSVKPLRVRCEYWDWLEVVESTTEQLHLTTSVADVVQVRRRPDRTKRETRALAMWRTEPSTSDRFFTVDPELVRIKLRQSMVVAERQQALSLQPETPGLLMSADACHMLVSSGATVVDAIRGGHAIRPLAGGGNDVFTLRDLLTVVNVEAPPPLVADDDRQQLRLDAWVARSGVELHVETIFTNTIAPFDAVSTSTDSGATVHRGGVLEAYGIVPGPLQYLLCAKLIRYGTDHQTGVDVVDKASVVDGDDGVYAVFTAPSDWGRVPLPDAVVNGSLDARLVRKTYGARMHFSTSTRLGVINWASVLQFVGGTLALFTVPWTLTELLIGLTQAFAATPPKWWSAFLHRDQ